MDDEVLCEDEGDWMGLYAGDTSRDDYLFTPAPPPGAGWVLIGRVTCGPDPCNLYVNAGRIQSPAYPSWWRRVWRWLRGRLARSDV